MMKLSALALVLAAALPACTDDGMMGMDGETQFRVTIQNVAPWTLLKSGTQTTRTDGTTGPIRRGESFEIAFTAGKHQALSFVSMLGQSNDWFFSPGPQGLALYNEDGAPIAGDITNQIHLYDAGTEYDQVPNVGDATGPKQPMPDFGAVDPNPNVREVPALATLSDGSTFAVGRVDNMIRVELVPQAPGQFVLRITNIAANPFPTAEAIGLSPVAWALHGKDAPLFTLGMPDRAQGLERVAESGNTAPLGASMQALTGAATPLSPGLFAVHQDPDPLFALGLSDDAMGLEALAEDGDASMLGTRVSDRATALTVASWGNYDVPVGRTQKAPAMPGESFQLDVMAMPGDRFSFASMFGMSNDWFFATAPAGIALFDADGMARRGDVTADVAIYDAGTEVDQELAIGTDTGPQQNGPNTGARDPNAQVREVSAAQYAAPASSHIRVTLEPM